MFTELEIKIIRALQDDFPLVSEPFKVLAEQLGISESELIAKTEEFKTAGIIRRFGAALRHREVGFVANAMVVWNVPEELTQDVGDKMAKFPQVSHCYQRPRFSDWPYNMFTMIHGADKDVCEKVAKEISEATGIKHYDFLYSTAELKKSSMKYFME